jgi:hypothetical protein
MASYKTFQTICEESEKSDQQNKERHTSIQTCVKGGQSAILPNHFEKMETKNDTESTPKYPPSLSQGYMPCVEEPELPKGSAESNVKLSQYEVKCEPTEKTERTAQTKERPLSSIPARKRTCSSQTNRHREFEPSTSNIIKSRQLKAFPNIRHRKSLVTVFIIVLLHLILNGPFYFYLFMEGFLMRDAGDSVVRTILFCISTLHIVLNPVVYVVRIPGFREFVKEKFSQCKQCVHDGDA